MGREVASREFTREDRRLYREKVRRCLDAFARMLSESQFEFERPHAGLEIELNLVNAEYLPAFASATVLASIANPDFQTELGQFNVEINVAPQQLLAQGLTAFEKSVRSSLNTAEARAAEAGAHLVMVGILPTLTEKDVTADSLTASPRYALLNEQIFAARGEDLHIEIAGRERLSTLADSIAPEAACTSAQFHLQVGPDQFAPYWNATQTIAGIQVALGANSPYLFGKELWRETRVPLFEQATDPRPIELKEQGMRPRVWFGERWITSVFDLFEENVRYFPSLLPICSDEDPFEMLDDGSTPSLDELTLHNGTIYRWNRPVYAVVEGRPHLRVENRALPAGPTVADVLANGAFFFGLIRTLVDADRPVWTQMSFSAAEENFHAGARDGIEAMVYWPGVGRVRATELVLRRLLPLAHEGLVRWGVDAHERDRLLGIIEQRCVTERTGSTWQVETVHQLETSGHDRQDALREMLRQYCLHMHSNEPVHTWPVGA
ncbi:MAG TPA: glutamate--cysteine ligase [Jiangellaceae bacterium]